jgi:hypothetical protein
MELPKPSVEQSSILDNLKYNNVVVDSVAGSGKTTTNLHIAKEYNDQNILLLTYNNKLKLETRNKIKNYEIPNMECHSYHSFCVKYYNRDCFTDYVIINLLKNNTKKLKDFSYDMIILDEAQDITPVYFKLILKIFVDNDKMPKLCILGDRAQSVYHFNKADERFIIFADKIFNINKLPWKSVNLNISFRITQQMADFINTCLYGKQKINAIKNGKKVRYIICDIFGKMGGSSERSFNEILYYLKLGYKYDDIFVIAPSVKSKNSPARLLANSLSDQKNIPVFVPTSDDEKLDEDILKSKIVFSTFHQVKGLERKVVIVFGFDNSYFKFFNRDVNPLICPNELYVACSRGLEMMSLFHHFEWGFLPFLKTAALRDICDFESYTKVKLRPDGESQNVKTSVVDLTRHLSSEVIQEATKYFDIIEINKVENIIKIPIKTKQKDLYESVSEITGIAIPSFFELLRTKKMSICGENAVNEIVGNDLDVLNNITKDNIKNIKLERLLYVANEWCCHNNGYTFKMKQISKYDWLTHDILFECYNRLNSKISCYANFEIKCSIENQKELTNRKLVGIIDCIDNNNIWEFKCVSSLEKTHFLQLAIYAYIYLKNMEINKNNLIKKIKHEQYDIVEYSTDDATDSALIIDILDNNNIIINDVTNNIFKINISQIKKNISKTKEIDDKFIVPKFYLFNIFDNNVYQIISNIERLTEMIEYIIHIKYSKREYISDEYFMEEINKMKSKYI